MQRNLFFIMDMCVTDSRTFLKQILFLSNEWKTYFTFPTTYVSYHQNMKLENHLVLHSNPQLVHLREVQLDEVDRIFNLKKCWLIIFLQILIALHMKKFKNITALIIKILPKDSLVIKILQQDFNFDLSTFDMFDFWCVRLYSRRK